MYGEDMGWWTRFLLWFQPSPETIVKAELRMSQLAAVKSQSMSEYAALTVKISDLKTDYHNARSLRLQAFLDDQSFDEYRNAAPGDQIPGY